MLITGEKKHLSPKALLVGYKHVAQPPRRMSGMSSVSTTSFFLAYLSPECSSKWIPGNQTGGRGALEGMGGDLEPKLLFTVESTNIATLSLSHCPTPPPPPPTPALLGDQEGL